MNKRLKELARKADFYVNDSAKLGYVWCSDELPIDENLEEFARLIREDEAKACAEHYLGIMRDAVEQAVLKEREACAKLCESMDVHPALNVWNGGPEWYKRQKECAEAIRARGKE
jgi:hypothetical protein